MKAESVRKIDELGRIALPVEMRNALGWNKESKISIIRQGDGLILQAFQGSSFVCGKEENIVPISGKVICQKCINEATKTHKSDMFPSQG